MHRPSKYNYTLIYSIRAQGALLVFSSLLHSHLSLHSSSLRDQTSSTFSIPPASAILSTLSSLTMATQGPVVNVLYGTVTGNAEEIARRIHLHLSSISVTPGLLRCLSDYADIHAFVKPAAHVNTYNIIVVSTTGDGDPPETIRKFMRLIRKKDPNKLKGLNYAVLGLGDTNYENFCRTGKRVDSLLAKLGATSFYKRGDADDGTGLENVVEPWLESLWTTLGEISSSFKNNRDENTPLEHIAVDKTEKKMDETDVDEISNLVKRVTIEELGFTESKLPRLFPPKISAVVIDEPKSYKPPLSVNPSFNPDVVRRASVTDAKQLTSEKAGKLVWHIEVTCSKDNKIEKKYLPGDAFGVIVENDAEEVKRFLSFVSTPPDAIVEMRKDNGDVIAVATASQFVRERIDLRTVPKKSLLRSLSEHCTDVEQRKVLLQLCSRDGRKQYTAELSKGNMSIVDVLEKKAPSCNAPLSLYLDQLPGIPPRWYSATSSPELDGESALQFAFSVVEKGLATNSLSKLCTQFVKGETPQHEVMLIPRAADSTSKFRPPPSLETSYIMIGPGTGVAPFRGFLRERSAQLKAQDQKEVGKTMLFFGCRTRDTDFLYKEDLQELEKNGVLNVLDIAFSREGPEKVYVQDRLLDRAKEVAEMIQNGASIFVCGDGGGMAQGVHAALGKMLGENCCKGDVEKGKDLLRNLGDEGRYVRDIWYHG